MSIYFDDKHWGIGGVIFNYSPKQWTCNLLLWIIKELIAITQSEFITLRIAGIFVDLGNMKFNYFVSAFQFTSQ